SRYVGATTLTLGGLFCVDENSSTLCLSLESGQPRWPDNIASKIFVNQQAATSIRAYPDGDNMFLMSPSAISAVSMVSGAPRSMTSPLSDFMPPLQSAQLSSLCLVELAY